MKVLRRGSVAVHFTDDPQDEGAEVEIEVDWNRRFDHMQQHSGNTHIKGLHYNLTGRLLVSTLFFFAAQHLITAIADRDFGHKTTSWLNISTPPLTPVMISSLYQESGHWN